MKRQARNDNPARIELLRSLQPPTLNGIEYLEVTSADQRTLTVTFVNPVAGLTKAHVRIDGGVRITGIHVLDATLAGREMTVTVDQAGDWSWYQLVLVDPADPLATPANFDPVLSSIAFSFKAACPSEFDCASAAACAPATYAEPLLDYLAKDYASLRRLMLDRMDALQPAGQPRHPADFSVALVELLAHVGDQLSDWQDAVATEAYLGTARRRVSLRRHARLLDYAVREGCNARVYVTIDIAPAADGQELPAGTPLLAQPQPAPPCRSTAALEALPDGLTQVFLTMHRQTLQSAQGDIAIHTWGDTEYCLATGATSAALVRKTPLGLQPGAVLILEEIASPATGLAQDADRRHRQAVRVMTVEDTSDPMGAVDPVTHAAVPVPLTIVTWHDDDALAFALRVSATVASEGASRVVRTGLARGNVVLADHGQAFEWKPLIPKTVPADTPYRPRLPDVGLAFAQPYAHQRFIDAGGSAKAALVQDARLAQPAGLQLLADDSSQADDQPDLAAEPWDPIVDLLGSDRFDQKFVVETEHDGSAWLRFGDDVFGAMPEPGARLLARYRLGGGAAGNVGPEAICVALVDAATLAPHVRGVRNPLPAQGGEEPESADSVKRYAPEAFRTQERAVTEADHAAVAERHPQVQRAVARLRWTGSWYTMFLVIDRRGGLPVDEPFRAAMVAHMERYRLTGYDLEVVEPVFVPLDIELAVCVLPSYFAASVEQQLLRRLGTAPDAQGRPGFFAPDNFSFGDPLPLSTLIEAAMSVTGVASVEVKTFQRWGRTAAGEIAAGILRTSPLEVLRLDNDPNFPENGRLVLTMKGGT
jgi:hypothetical protein